ncbi:MAG: hypothetical protein JWQ96_963 [Segetibacter sp.]|nr:hypothetical protein [Segetibacter sp.]
MKGYRTFIIVFLVVFVVYVIAELNKPKPVNWSVTLSKNDKNPFGSYILYDRLKDLFPSTSINSYRLPIYDQLNDYEGNQTGYIILSADFRPTPTDYEELQNYVSQGNYLFVSASNFASAFLDSLKLEVRNRVSLLPTDSTSINFVNPLLKAPKDYTFQKLTIDEYFSSFDTTKTIVLGVNNFNEANFVKVPHGDGAFLVHASPLCFSNYFMLKENNEKYTATAISYLPANLSTIYWDEYYKLGKGAADTPLRFLLSNEYLTWALRLSLMGMLIFVFFEMKRKQRIIPVITPLRNSTLDFIKTVASVYFNEKDNTGVANKKIAYFFEFVRNKYFLQTNEINDLFIEQLSRKSGVAKDEVSQLINFIQEVRVNYRISDKGLLLLNQEIDDFYKQVT